MFSLYCWKLWESVYLKTLDYVMCDGGGHEHPWGFVHLSVWDGVPRCCVHVQKGPPPLFGWGGLKRVAPVSFPLLTGLVLRRGVLWGGCSDVPTLLWVFPPLCPPLFCWGASSAVVVGGHSYVSWCLGRWVELGDCPHWARASFCTCAAALSWPCGQDCGALTLMLCWRHFRPLD